MGLASAFCGQNNLVLGGGHPRQDPDLQLDYFLYNIWAVTEFAPSSYWCGGGCFPAAVCFGK